MKKQFILVGLLAVGFASAQTDKDYLGKVGINILTPQATMDIRPNDDNRQETATTNEGILIPKLSKTRVANIKDVLLVEGTLVYVTDETTSPISAYTGSDTKVAKITEKGYYFYNGTEWVKVAIGSSISANLYTADGVLSSDRVVNQAGKWLDFNDGGVRITGHNGVYFPLTVNAMASGGSGGILIQPNGDHIKRVELNTTPEGNFRLWADGDKIYVNRATGNVGIGTNEPTAKLDVDGNARILGSVDHLFRLQRNGSADYTDMVKRPNGTFLITNNTANEWKFGISLDANGNTGIGTETPKAKLDVEGGVRVLQGTPQGDGTNLGYAFGNDGDTGLFATADSTNSNISTNLDLYVNNVSRVNINQQGDVKVANLAGDGDKIVVANNDGTLTKGVSVSSFATSNIYTANGSINENRTIEMNNSNLMFTGTGNVGIGTDLPVAKLDVAGTVKISDGTQGAGKVLTSNSDGVAHWALPAVTYQNYIGVFPDYAGYYPSTELSTEETDYSRTSFSFTLAPGKYQIFVNGLLSLRPNTMVTLPVGGYTTDWSDNAIVDSASSIYLRYAFKDSTLDTELSNIFGGLDGAVGNSGYTALSYPFDQGQINFTTFIENKTSAPKTYYLYARVFRADITNGKHHIIYDLFNGRWGEESITAVRIGD